MLRISIPIAMVLTVLASPAFAHPDHASSGFFHPLTGPDHVLAMVGAGMWAVLLAVRRPAAALLVPASFLAMMTVGAAAGFAGIKLPLAEAGVLASVFMLGGLVLAAVRVRIEAAMLLVGIFAVLHGYAHAVEAPETDPGSYILGFLAATALLQTAGFGLGWVVQRLVGDVGLRALGGLVLAGGALVLATH